VAVALMLAVATIWLVSAVVVVADPSTRRRKVPISHPANYSPTHVDHAISLGYFAGFVLLVTAVIYVVLALHLTKGDNRARLVIWTWSGIDIVMWFHSLATTSGSIRGWAERLVSLGLTIAVVSLLATPSSNAYFRHR
jgi:hypothetical protein